MEDLYLSEDLHDELMVMLDDNVFVRWRIDFSFFNRSIYGRLFERVGSRFGDGNPHLPQIKGLPNTSQLLKTGFYQKVRAATSSPSQSPATASASLTTIRRRRAQSSIVHLLQQRERNSWPSPTQCYVNNVFLPNSIGCVLPTEENMKYCSVYSPDNGRHLLVVSMDGQVTVFNTENRNKYKEVAQHKLDLNTYSILDLDISPDGREFLVSTWRNNVYTCNVLGDDENNVNFRRSHQLMTSNNNNNHNNCKLGTISTCFSNDAKEILTSATNGCIYLIDRTTDEKTMRIVQDARDEVNAVRFLDSGSNNVIIGGSDRGIIEIWDRRLMNGGVAAKSRKSVATLIGHYDGITYVDPKGDGRHFITNSKDQSVKLWDIRNAGRCNQIKKARKTLAQQTWNFRCDSIPQEFYEDRSPLDGDCSVMTYRGHRVAKTLIRAKFSPQQTTGNRFIYTGCATGRVIIYDTLTGKMVDNIEGHTDVVRDVSWHPLRSEIASASLDETVHVCVYKEKMDRLAVEPLRRSKRIAAKRARISM